MILGLRISIASGLAVGWLSIGTAVYAHHSAAAAYDESKQVQVEGTVTRILVRNPHSWVFLDAADDKGQKTEWQVEMGGAPAMAWAKDGLPVGTMIKVSGHPSRAPGSHGITGATLMKPDGTPLDARSTRGAQ